MKIAKQIVTIEKVSESWTPLLELAAREVFEIMLGCRLETLESASPVPSDFTAMVGLAGQLCGLLTLRCSAHAAARMASKMLGSDIKETDRQMWDAIGEIANVVAGNFKNKLTGVAEGCVLSVPTVICGSDYTCHSMADREPLEITLLFENTPITLAVEIHS
jgi:chemotaxis protein CheX